MKDSSKMALYTAMVGIYSIEKEFLIMLKSESSFAVWDKESGVKQTIMISCRVIPTEERDIMSMATNILVISSPMNHCVEKELSLGPMVALGQVISIRTRKTVQAHSTTPVTAQKAQELTSRMKSRVQKLRLWKMSLWTWKLRKRKLSK